MLAFFFAKFDGFSAPALASSSLSERAVLAAALLAVLQVLDLQRDHLVRVVRA
eukprot:NODE_5623_length_567_cov_225.759766.p5 GENE.NODE_5623_length_567_cov_225.759766~~NODE_5623_length_567_cov_225.759766.p5  ORF type:complete len:53 (-),score=9.32 NODE_5623_length_567_cov_225.759766:109-267(-)